MRQKKDQLNFLFALLGSCQERLVVIRVRKRLSYTDRYFDPFHPWKAISVGHSYRQHDISPCPVPEQLTGFPRFFIWIISDYDGPLMEQRLARRRIDPIQMDNDVSEDSNNPIMDLHQ
jgi:hypothetical protein